MFDSYGRIDAAGSSVHLFESCCCGATLTCQGFSSQGLSIAEQAKQFREAHTICRERRKVEIRGADPETVAAAVKAAAEDSDG